MTMPTVPYNGTASTPRIIDQPVSGMVGPYRVHTAPAPPPKGKGHSTFGHYKRPNADPARRGAYGSLKKAGMLPVIKPDDIGRSQTSQGAPLQRGIFGSVYDSIVGALEPMATIVEEGPAELTRAERVPAQPAAPPPAPRKTMAELWDFIAGNFMCEHGPDQPCLRSSADLGGKLILISNVHAELVGMGQIKDLLRRFMRDGDVFLAERDPRYVGPEMVPFGPCFGVPQERCIPIDLPGLSDKLNSAASIGQSGCLRASRTPCARKGRGDLRDKRKSCAGASRAKGRHRGASSNGIPEPANQASQTRQGIQCGRSHARGAGGCSADEAGCEFRLTDR